jgi:hypothetical protein
MPRFRPKPKLERSALADLWNRTLARIPTLYGRLAYLASLRDSDYGTYRHQGLLDAFGREESSKALEYSHEQVFEDWLNFSLAEKRRDLRDYITALNHSASLVVDHWLQSGIYRSFVPAAAADMEIELFCSDIEALLEVIRAESAGPQPDPGSSRPA